MMQFTLPEIWKRHDVLFGIHNENTNTKILEYLGANLRTDIYSY